MDHATHNKIVSFIWSIADDCLRDVFVRGKYRDVILPMFVLRRIDCLLEDTKEAVLAEVKFQKDEAGMAVLDPDGLREASGQVFYNTSKFTLKSLLGNPTSPRSSPSSIFATRSGKWARRTPSTALSRNLWPRTSISPTTTPSVRTVGSFPA